MIEAPLILAVDITVGFNDYIEDKEWPEEANKSLIIYIGIFCRILHFTATFSHLLKSINRCSAILFPIMYHNYFTIRIASISCATILVLCLIVCILFYLDGYAMVYSTELINFTPANPNCGKSFLYYFMAAGKIIIMGLTLVGDGITLRYLKSFNRLITNAHKGKSGGIVKPVPVNDKQFFFQSFVTSIIYTVMLIIPFALVPFATDSVIRLLITAFNWLPFHALNELLFIVFTIMLTKKPT